MIAAVITSAAEALKPPGRSPAALVALGLFLVTALVFWPATNHDFVNYDDPDYVTANPHVQQGLTGHSVRWAFTTGHASNWHPLTWLSHMLDSQLFGSAARGHHRTSVVLHGVNAALAFLALRRLTGATGRSALVAALFALHPLRVESVAWVAERKDVLSGMFFLLSLWAYARYARGRNADDASAPRSPHSAPEANRGGKEEQTLRADGRGTNPQRRPQSSRAESDDAAAARGRAFDRCETGEAAGRSALDYGLALGFFALGLMSKPMLVTLPFVLLLLDFWPLKRLELPVLRFRRTALAERPSGPTQPLISPGQLVVEKLPFFALAAVSCGITFGVQRRGGAVASLGGLPLAERLANALVSYVRYLGKTVWPENLSVLYPHPGQWPGWQVALAAGLLVGVTVAVVHWARRRPYALTGWFWFTGMLVPVIGLVQVGIQSMADRYTYLPQLGVWLALVWGLGDVLARWKFPRGAGAAASAVALLVCGVLTRGQLRHWRDSEALFRHAVRATRNNYLAHNNLGFHLSAQGRIDEALEQYRRALEINPHYEEALNNYGHALARKGRHAEALAYFEAALRIRPEHPEVRNNLGNALSELGRLDEAIAHYRFVLERNPNHADAHNNLGTALAMKGDFTGAVTHLSEALRLKPDYAGAHGNLGNALAAQGKFPEAIEQYRKAIALNPNDAQAHNNLGNALAESGRPDEAVTHYRRALQLRADNPEAHFNLGVALLRLGDRAGAKSHFQAAIRLRPNYPQALQQLQAVEPTLSPP